MNILKKVNSRQNITAPVDKSSHICRVCLKPGNIPIFGNDDYEDVSSFLENLTNIKINAHDLLPKYLCKACNILLDGAMLLIENAKKSNEVLAKVHQIILADGDHHSYLVNITHGETHILKSDKSEHGSLEQDHNVAEVYIDHEEFSFEDKKYVEEQEHFENQEYLDDQEYLEEDNDSNNHKEEVAQYTKEIDTQLNIGNKKLKDKNNRDENLVNNESCRAEIKTRNYVKDLTKNQMKCPLCQKIFKYCDIIRHVKDHTEGPNTRCICCFCNKSYKKSHYICHLRLHILGHNYMCDHCGVEVLGRRNFKLHYRTHENVFPYICSKCPYKGKTITALRSHMKMHSGADYICSDCGKQFRSRPNLQKHMLLHQPESRFSCDICDKGFYFKAELAQHHKIKHLGIKDHVCDKCGNAFSKKKLLRAHERSVHKVEKRTLGRFPDYLKGVGISDGEISGNQINFKCIECEESFTSNIELEEHTQIYHDLGNEIIVTTD